MALTRPQPQVANWHRCAAEAAGIAGADRATGDNDVFVTEIMSVVVRGWHCVNI